MADHFARPLRLTRQEAFAVYVRATELAATPGMPGAPALDQRAGQAPRRPWARRPSAMRRASPALTPGRRRRYLDAVRTAAQERQRLRIAYAAASTGERTERTDRARGGVRQLGPVVRGRLGRRRRRRASAAGGPDRRGATLGRAIRAARARRGRAAAVHAGGAGRPDPGSPPPGGPLGRRVLRRHGSRRGRQTAPSS